MKNKLLNNRPHTKLMVSALWFFTILCLSAQIPDKASLCEFKSVCADDSGLKLVFQDSGSRFNYTIGDSERKVGEYGEIVRLPYGARASFVSKNIAISFTAETTNREFQIERKLDFRSFGNKLTIEKFSLKVNINGEICFSPITRIVDEN